MFYMDKGCLLTDAYFMAGYFIDRSVLIMRLMYDHLFLMSQSHDGVKETKEKGKERKGTERNGQERGIQFQNIEFPLVCFLPSMQESFPRKQP